MSTVHRQVYLSLLGLAMMAIPVGAGHTTSKLALPLAALAVFGALLGVCRINKEVAPLLGLYGLLVLSLYPVLSTDSVLLLQMAGAASFILALTLCDFRVEENRVPLYLILATVLVGAIQFPQLLAWPVLGVPRLDILNWQHETGFFFGINRYLLALFVIFAIMVAARQQNTILALGFLLFYAGESLLLGSRTHALLSVAALAVLASRSLKGLILLLLAVAAVGGLAVTQNAALAERLEQTNLLGRTQLLFEDPEATPRGYILAAFLDCAGTSELLFGNGIKACVERKDVGDFDNTFLYVTGAGGLATAAIFAAILLYLFRFIQRCDLPLAWRGYLAGSYLLLLNVDVLVMKAALFLPAVLYLVNRRGDALVPLAGDAEPNATPKPAYK